MHFLRDVYRTAEKFRAREEAEVIESIRLTGERYGDQVRACIFYLMVTRWSCPPRRSLTILETIRTHTPAVRRISSYRSAL